MIYLDDLRNATGGQLFGEAFAHEFTRFCLDPALVQPGELFVAIRSDYENGQVQIAEAVKHGAAGILCDTPPQARDYDVTILIVGDTTAAMGQWAAYILRQYGTLVIAVAGLVGKHVTAASIAAVLGAEYRVYCAPNQLGGIEGLAISLASLESSHQIVVVEIAAERLRESQAILAILQPSIAVITRTVLTDSEDDHAIDEARELIQALPSEGIAILNADNPKLRSLIQNFALTVLTYSITTGDDSNPADLAASEIQYLIDKVRFDLRIGSEWLRDCSTPALGEVGLEAALAALAVGQAFQMPTQQALEALKTMPPLPGGMTLRMGINSTILIDNSDNASLASSLAALKFLTQIELGTSRRIVVLGDLNLDLPKQTEGYQTIGRQVRGCADRLITLGDAALDAARAAVSVGMEHVDVLPMFRPVDVVSAVRQAARSGDAVLFVGDGTKGMTQSIEQLLSNTEDSAKLPKIPPRWRILQGASWVELNLDALAQNVRQVKDRVGSGVNVMAVVKANAYGHGLLPTALTALRNGADLLAVSSVEEGIQLREIGVDAPILVLGFVPFSMLLEAIEQDLTLSVWDREIVRQLARIAAKLNKPARIHIRIDTGLGDYGLPSAEAASFIREVIRLENIVIDGLYTNFAAADILMEAAATHEQLKRFQAVVDSLRATGLSIPYIHAANSCAILTLPASFFTTVRAGILLYGLHPSLDVSCPPGFKRALSWKTRVAQIKEISAGTPIGYGGAFRAEHPLRIAMLPVGFAHGFRSKPRNWGAVLIAGKRARLVGLVGMDHCAIDISELPDVFVGQEVVLIGSQGRDEITVEDVARRVDCTNYEVVASISPRIPRIPSWRFE